MDFAKRPSTWRDARRNLSPVRRRQPAEPQASAARRERGKPEGTPQGGPGGSRENAARRDRRMGASLQGERDRSGQESDCRWSVVRHGGFPEPPRPARAGVVRHDPGTMPAVHRRCGPEEHGRLRPNGYSGLRRGPVPCAPCRGCPRPGVSVSAYGAPALSRATSGPQTEAHSRAGRSPAATWRFSSAWTRERSSGWVTPMQRPCASRTRNELVESDSATTSGAGPRPPLRHPRRHPWRAGGSCGRPA